MSEDHAPPATVVLPWLPLSYICNRPPLSFQQCGTSLSPQSILSPLYVLPLPWTGFILPSMYSIARPFVAFTPCIPLLPPSLKHVLKATNLFAPSDFLSPNLPFFAPFQDFLKDRSFLSQTSFAEDILPCQSRLFRPDPQGPRHAFFLRFSYSA